MFIRNIRGTPSVNLLHGSSHDRNLVRVHVPKYSDLRQHDLDVAQPKLAVFVYLYLRQIRGRRW